MGISDMHVIPMIITCMLQGTLCDTGIPCTFYGGNICSVGHLCNVLLWILVVLKQNIAEMSKDAS